MCRGDAGEFTLGHVPGAEDAVKGSTKPVTATLTLLERAPNGGFVPVDSTEITLPVTHGVADPSKLIIEAGGLFS